MDWSWRFDDGEWRMVNGETVNGPRTEVSLFTVYEASWQALCDGLELALAEKRER